MKLLVLSLLFLTACASLATGIDPTLMQYTSDTDDEWRTDCPAFGDCEDFALCTAKANHGGGYLILTAYKGQSHAVWVKGNLMADQLNVIARPDLEQRQACDLTSGRMGIYSSTHFSPFTTPAEPLAGKCRKAAKELAR